MEASMRNLVELFSKEINKEYKIPLYQRNYTWERDNINQLFYDLERAKDFEGYKKHHFGSVYLKEELGENQRKSNVIIDGQQRMTTILMIIIALKAKIGRDKEKAKEDEDYELFGELTKVEADLEGYLYTDIGGSKVLKMRLNLDDNYALEEILEGETTGSLGIKSNYRLIEELVEESEMGTEDFLDSIRKLEVMQVILHEYDDEQEIFDGLNAKGKPLNFGEQVKNYFLMGKNEDEQLRLYREYWLPIERGLDYKIGNNFKNLMTLYFTILRGAQIVGGISNYLRAKNYMDENGLDDVEGVLSGIKETLELRSEIYDLKITGDKVRDSLSRIATLADDQMMVYLIPSYKEYKEGKLDEREYIKTLKYLEGYVSRRIISGYTNVGEESIYDWLHKIGKESKVGRTSYEEFEENTYSERIKNVVNMLKGANELPTNRVIRERAIKNKLSLKGKNRDRLVYLLERVENGHGKEFLNIHESYGVGKAYSIEHIMPSKLTPRWESMLGEEYEEVHNEYLNTIGNLTLTGYNSEYSNKSFQEKQVIEGGFKDSRFTELNYLPALEENWTKEEIEKRARAIIERVIELYPY